ncbi:adenosylcobalamin-dependent ribonucleoside-diphosphate reductase [bacterium]|jgi:ribonucleoside-diphosphate reductase alpha chain|nr:adenosylcobalamin-dependent ribonucleoside-diphosphate reductase [bacterium]MBT4649272.1 adenosylcobalamin-dependent ribonucleoside-diphosphate reductase [bacterium]
MLPKITKRNGQTENFDQQKITSSLQQAIKSSALSNNPVAQNFTDQVVSYLDNNHTQETLTSDDVRSAVNIILLDNDLPQVAKTYFKTRDKKLSNPDITDQSVKQIKKRDGTIANFDTTKVATAIQKAGLATGEFDASEAQKLSDIVLGVLDHKFDGHTVPSVEEIQDVIEIILIQSNWAKTAKAFILYREQRKKIRLEHGKETACQEVLDLEEKNIYLSKQAQHVLNNSTNFDELGRIIFIDRYSIKSKRDEMERGDLVVVISQEDRKYPKKDLGIIKEMSKGGKILLHVLTGVFADEENNFELELDATRCDKPIESINDAHRRIAKAVASVEKTEEKKQEAFETFFEALHQKHIQPAGRIMTGANVDQHGQYTSNLTLFNCYVVPSPLDSRKSIIRETLFQMVEIMSRGGGVGMSLSALRPRYAYVRGVHGKSSGSVSWGGLFSHTTGLIEQGGSRRGALMLMQWDWHPDVIEFIEAKTKDGQIENANISVMVSDKFMEAVKNDGNWNLEFPDYENPTFAETYDKLWDGNLHAWKEAGYPTKIYKTVRARDLWNKIIASAHASAEPGIVFMERYNKLSNSYYYNTIISTNPCGEQGLPGWGVCNLGHLYLASFAEQKGEDEQGPIYQVDWEALKKTARTLTHFLDNVTDLTPYYFKENEDNQKAERRIGGGTLGLGELLIKLRMRYGSDESLEFIDKLYSTITTEMYRSSTELAKEKGSFPKFDADKFLESGFMKTMPEDVRQGIRANGIRNVTLTTQAPTGTVGSMLSTSTGVEPYYAFKFFQQSRLGFHEVAIPLAKQYEDKDGNLPNFFASAMELKPMDHVKVQAAIQKWTDSSISKTANAPSDFTVEETADLYEQAYELGCKGVTIYRDQCRTEQILSTDAKTGEKNLAYNGKNKKKEEAAQEEEKVVAFPDPDKVVMPEMQNPRKHFEIQKEEVNELPVTDLSANAQDDPSTDAQDGVKYGSGIGDVCPQCKQGVMVKLGGCTECSKQCGFKGACDMK